MTVSQSLKGSSVHPYDLPDVAHPPVPEGYQPPRYGDPVSENDEGKSSQELAQEFYVELDGQNEPLAMSPEWIRSEALHAAVATAQMEVTGKGVVWGSEEILDLARIYRAYIEDGTDA